MERDRDTTRAVVGRPHGAPRVERHLGEPVRAPSGHAVQERRTGEAGDERVGGSRDQIGRSANLPKATVDDHADHVGQRRGVLEVVA